MTEERNKLIDKFNELKREQDEFMDKEYSNKEIEEIKKLIKDNKMKTVMINRKQEQRQTE
ncbi:hypothetical protein COB55_03550 [Candidatus Wolfebacteria bacterium]|nr:MAG: hypothetical protein COB55_03550 [Candidatus Wolfebacteria bacterium]